MNLSLLSIDRIVKKWMYLLLALLLPGLIFVFLKYAGSNRFDVPVYPLPGAALRSDCAGEVTGDYVLPDSARGRIEEKGKHTFVILFNDREVKPEVLAADLTDEMGPGVKFIYGDTLSTSESGLARWKSCVFLLQPPWQTVLSDPEGRIRGFYDLRSREEVDRLRVELKILLEQY